MRIKKLIVASALLISSNAVFATNYADENTAYRNKDYATAMAELRPLAVQGDADAQLLVGFMYQDGEGVQKDSAEAIHWYKLSADQGNKNAQFNMGILYEFGRGVAVNLKEAFR